MSYERVSTPAFWIDYLQYLKAIGWYKYTWGWRGFDYSDVPTQPANLHEFNPAKTRPYPTKMESNVWSNYQTYGFLCQGGNEWTDDSVFPFIDDKIAQARFIGTANFGGLLGHDLHSTPPISGDAWRIHPAGLSGYQLFPEDSSNEQIYNTLNHSTVSGTDKVYGGDWLDESTAHNAYILPSSDGYILADYSGGLQHLPEASFSDQIGNTGVYWDVMGYNSTNNIRMTLVSVSEEIFDGNTIPMLGSHVFGRKFIMPTAPNMSLTQEYLFDGTKTQTTRGGSTLTNTMWHSPPNWGDLPAWGRTDTGASGLLANRNFISGRRGRRSWNLKFAFMSEDKVFPKYILKSDGDNFHDMSGITDLATDTHSASSTLYGILSLTLGGAIPFIFQPDKDEDNFAIVRFDQKSIKLRQASHRTYDFSCKLEEVW